MSKINKYTIFIFIIMFFTISSIMITKNIVWKEAYKKYNPIIDSNYANIIFTFSKNREHELLQMSTRLIGIEIVYMQSHDEDMKHYKHLCPYLNIAFKNLIIENYYDNKEIEAIHKQEKEIFLKGYDKLSDFCQSQNTLK